MSFIAAALPWIQAALGVASLAQTLRPPQASTPATTQPLPEKPPTLGWDEARQRAEETLNPIYDTHLEDTLKNVDQELIARGFFGQLPGAVLSGSRATDVQRNRASAIGTLANQLQTQSEQDALTQQQLAAQWALNQGQLGQQRWGQKTQGIGSLFNWAMQYPLQWASVTGTMPDGTLTPKTKSALAQAQAQNQVSAGVGPIDLSSIGGIPAAPRTLSMHHNYIHPY